MRGFSPSSSHSCLRAASIAAALHGSTVSSAAAAASRMRVSRSAGSGSTSWNRKPAKPANSSSRAIFSWTIGAAARRGPRASRCPARGGTRRAGRRTRRRERAQVHAVHPVELRVVERRRARAHALEREALDQLVGGHDRRLAVGRPAEEREEVHERLGHVARARNSSTDTAPCRFESFLPSAPNTFGTCA